jgi:hypothetical protein
MNLLARATDGGSKCGDGPCIREVRVDMTEVLATAQSVSRTKKFSATVSVSSLITFGRTYAALQSARLVPQRP